MVAALGRGGTAESGSTMKFMMAYISTPYNKPERIAFFSMVRWIVHMQSALHLEVSAEATSAVGDSHYDQDSVRKALDDLISRALTYRMGPELKELFDFMKRFPHFAPYNGMLLHVESVTTTVR